MERVTRLELATSSLARRCSTTELHPRKRIGIIARPLRGATFFHRDKMAPAVDFLNLKLLPTASHQQMKPMKALILGSVASFGITLAVLAQTPTPPVPGSPAAPAPVSPAAPAAAASPATTASPATAVSPALSATPMASPSAANEFANKIKQRSDRNFKKGFHISVNDDEEDSAVRHHGSNEDFPLAAIPIAVIAMLSVFGAPVAIVAVIMLVSWAKTRSLHRTVRAMVEKGQPVPPELLASPAGAPLRPWYDLRRGIVLLAVGFGIVMFFGISAGWDNGVWALGSIPALIGVGYILAWRLANKHANGFKM
jgi:Domain of unknown function (DUF6249)